MAKRIGRLALLLSAVLAACSPTIERVRQDGPATALTVRVGAFSTNDIRVTNIGTSGVPYADRIPNLIVEALQKAGVRAELASSAPTTDSITVTGGLSLLDGGDRSLRCMVGYGAGAVRCSVNGSVRDADGRLVGEFGVDRASSLCDFGDDTLRRCVKALCYDVATMITTGRYAGGSSSGRPSVEARLHEIQRLRDQGLISVDEYERTRAEILREL